MGLTNLRNWALSFLVLTYPIHTQAETALSVCVKNTNGRITAERTCPAGSKKLSEKSYSEGRNVVFYVAAKGAAFKSLAAAVTKIKSLYPAADKPVVVKIAPGEYEINEVIFLPDNIHIIGSGKGVTNLETNTSVPFNLGNNTTFRDLTINSTFSGGDSLFLKAEDKTGILFEDLDITMNTTQNSRIAIYLEDSSARINNVSISGTGRVASGVVVSGPSASAQIRNLDMDLSLSGGFGIEVSNGGDLKISDSRLKLNTVSTFIPPAALRIGDSETSAEIENVSAALIGNTSNCSCAYITEATNVIIRNSKFVCAGPSVGTVSTSENAAVSILNSYIQADAAMATLGADNNSTIKIAHSHLDGAAVYESTGGSITCTAVTDENFAFSQSSCP
jgi:hypothetical protein